MNAEEMFDGEVIRAKYIVEHYIESGITTWIYIPKEKEENKMSETNLEHYKEDLKGILKYHFDSPRAVLNLIRKKFGCQIKLEYGEHPTSAIIEWMAQTYRETILDDVEKDYLSAIIKPFKCDVDYICKRLNHGGYYIAIVSNGSDVTKLPYFPNNEMYKGMELDRRYKLKELGL